MIKRMALLSLILVFSTSVLSAKKNKKILYKQFEQEYTTLFGEKPSQALWNNHADECSGGGSCGSLCGGGCDGATGEI